MKQGIWGIDRRRIRRPVSGDGFQVSSGVKWARRCRRFGLGTPKLLNSLTLKLPIPFQPIPACSTGYTPPFSRHLLAPTCRAEVRRRRKSEEDGRSRQCKWLSPNRGRTQSCQVAPGRSGGSRGKRPFPRSAELHSALAYRKPGRLVRGMIVRGMEFIPLTQAL